MKERQEQIKNMREVLERKKERLFDYQKNARKIEHESEILKLQILKLEQRIKRLEFVDAKIHRVIPLSTSIIKVEIENEKEEEETGVFFYLISYDQMDSDFKSLISILRFSHVFLHYDLDALYWTSLDGKIVERKLIDLL